VLGGAPATPQIGPSIVAKRLDEPRCHLVRTTEVSLGSGHIVLDGGSATPPPKGAQPPIFGPCLLWPNGRPSQLLLSTCYMCHESGKIGIFMSRI